ncbi:MAG: CoB--CoM heterodisulfide reductase iron-sulfur subunit B family protein [Candidatus Thorarchaeota archaeon]|nr:MAG: CoB--CoM heterodisulfide reductase subunit B [Candidatus Thorarchaeota archaeon]RLI62481.1 MAG: CoB--CoM heterodisulfide reductase subunit B [Candidatus Thorarchaeota archaeon]
MPTYNLYMGCSVPANYPNYEAATLKVAEALGMELIYMEGVGCCGSPNLRAIDYFGWLLVNARTLAIGEKTGHDIVTPCNGCFGSLKDVLYHLKHDEEDMKKVNQELEKFGLELKGTVRVRHVIEAMYTDIGIEEIEKKVTRPLDGVRIAIHYGCHLLRPADVTEVTPDIFDELLRVTGATVVEYPLWKQCCGATVLPVNEPLAVRLARDKLKSIKDAGAEFIMVVCPACGNQLDLQQFGIKDTYGEEYNLPVLFYPQILALAMGMSEDDVGLSMNRVPADPILDHLTG